MLESKHASHIANCDKSVVDMTNVPNDGCDILQRTDYDNMKCKTSLLHQSAHPSYTRCHTEGNLNIACLNVRSLFPKIDQIRTFVKKHNFDIFGVNETWLDQSISDIEIEIEGYNIIRKDRNRNGGGVCVYIRHYYKYTCIAKAENQVESIWLECNFNNVKLAIGCMYRPPDSDHEYYGSMIDEIMDTRNSYEDIVPIGDLNFNYTFDEQLSKCPIHYIESLFDFKQLVQTPTRETTKTSTLIDIILTSIPTKHISTRVIKCSVSDYYCVKTILKYDIGKPIKKNVQDHEVFTFRDFKHFAKE